jgi:arabinose-5-phosphate isomerase
LDSLNATDFLAAGRSVMLAQSEALQLAASRLDRNFNKAVGIVLGCGGKVIVTGVGKPGPCRPAPDSRFV